MTFSIWNRSLGLYDYFETAGGSANATHRRPRHLRSTSKVGTHPEAAAWPLPLSVKHVGQGGRARGFIASKDSNGLGSVPFDLTGPNLIVVGVVAFLAYEHWWKPRCEARR